MPPSVKLCPFTSLPLLLGQENFHKTTIFHLSDPVGFKQIMHRNLRKYYIFRWIVCDCRHHFVQQWSKVSSHMVSWRSTDPVVIFFKNSQKDCLLYTKLVHTVWVLDSISLVSLFNFKAIRHGSVRSKLFSTNRIIQLKCGEKTVTSFHSILRH